MTCEEITSSTQWCITFLEELISTDDYHRCRYNSVYDYYQIFIDADKMRELRKHLKNARRENDQPKKD